uniref:Transforming membrane receptor-like protein n=1 Tax=Human herpesvirus 8 TaxID=37296 RepID=Q9WHI3_HHV8|nr:transforming membrane receptor-like protein [Human gammaherpesvirus 8]
MFLYVVCSLAVCFPGLLSLHLSVSPQFCPAVLSTSYTLTCLSDASLPISWYCNGTRLLRITGATLTIPSLTGNFTCVDHSGLSHSIWIQRYPPPVLQTLCAQPSTTVTCGQRVSLHCSTSANTVTIWRLQNEGHQPVSQTYYYNFTLMNQTQGCYTCSNGLSSRMSNRICFWAPCANITPETDTVSVRSTTGFKTHTVSVRSTTGFTTFSTNRLVNIIPATTHAVVVVEKVKSLHPHIEVPFLVFMTLVALIGTMCGILGTIIFAHCQKQSDSNKTVQQQLRDYYSLHDFNTEDYTQPVDWY